MRKPRPQEQYPYLLVHRGKHDDRYIVANNNEEEQLAWLAMFRALDEWDGYYGGGEDMDGDEQAWYEGAKAGDWQCAKWLLDYRSDYEYEHVFGECISTPSELMEKLNEKP